MDEPQSLGALTHGDRRATESRDLSQFNLDTKYGRMALENVLRSIVRGVHGQGVPPPPSYGPGDFFQEMRQYLEGVGVLTQEKNKGAFSIEKDAGSLSKFLNRILGLPVHAQNGLFQFFLDMLNAIVSQARKDGRYDMGILDLGIGSDHVEKKEVRVFLGRIDAGSYRTEMVKIEVERGMPWPDAFELYTESKGEEDGFYFSNSLGRGTVVLAVAMGKKRADTRERLYNVHRPNTGMNPRPETIAEVKKRYRRIGPDQAESVWKDQFLASATQCTHAYYHGKCKNEIAGISCEVGRRTRTYYVLSGSVLSVWPVVESVLQGLPATRQNRMQVIRVRTVNDQKIVGVLVPNICMKALIAKLEEHTGRSYIETSKMTKNRI